MIANILCHLVNMAILEGNLPSSYKIGCVTPVHKKGKPVKKPTNYRQITVSASIGKITEKHMLLHSRMLLDPNQARGQFCFCPGVSPIHAAEILTEVIAETYITNQQLLITFLDKSKAFDVVNPQVPAQLSV